MNEPIQFASMAEKRRREFILKIKLCSICNQPNDMHITDEQGNNIACPVVNKS